MIRIAIVIGSTRPRRRTAVVARWVAEVAARHRVVAAGEAEFAVVDLADFGLPVLDEPLPAMFGQYQNPHTQRWSDTIASFDGFVFVTPEYNHSAPAGLKNAIDFLYSEWNNKAAGFVSHGVEGGVRAVAQLRQTMTAVRVACVSTQVALSAFTNFERTDPADPGTIAPGPRHEPALVAMLDELVAWSGALKTLRTAPDRATG